ncbi:MAG TPA: hypothetical protein VF183_07250 [Acidimicrobiales bacterium]
MSAHAPATPGFEVDDDDVGAKTELDFLSVTQGLRDERLAGRGDPVLTQEGSWYAVWTSRAAREAALKLVRPRETTFRKLIEGAEPWDIVERRRSDGSISKPSKLVAQKQRDRRAGFRHRLQTIGVTLARTWTGCSIFGPLIPNDRRTFVEALPRFFDEWEVYDPVGAYVFIAAARAFDFEVHFLIELHGPVARVSVRDSALGFALRWVGSLDSALGFVRAHASIAASIQERSYR